MVTLFIIFAIFCLIMMARKDKHNKEEDAEAILKLPSFSIKAKEMSTFSKFMNLAIDKRKLLKSFSYEDNVISLQTEDESIFSASLSTLFVDFEKSNGVISYKLKDGKDKMSFYQTSNISDKEWDAISSVLCLANETRGRDIFSKSSKYIGYFGAALKAIKALS